MHNHQPHASSMELCAQSGVADRGLNHTRLRCSNRTSAPTAGNLKQSRDYDTAEGPSRLDAVSARPTNTS